MFLQTGRNNTDSLSQSQYTAFLYKKIMKEKCRKKEQLYFYWRVGSVTEFWDLLFSLLSREQFLRPHHVTSRPKVK